MISQRFYDFQLIKIASVTTINSHDKIILIETYA